MASFFICTPGTHSTALSSRSVLALEWKLMEQMPWVDGMVAHSQCSSSCIKHSFEASRGDLINLSLFIE